MQRKANSSNYIDFKLRKISCDRLFKLSNSVENFLLSDWVKKNFFWSIIFHLLTFGCDKVQINGGGMETHGSKSIGHQVLNIVKHDLTH